MALNADAAPPLSLGGSLADFPLADVLTFLNMGQASGAIEARSRAGASRIYLEAGEVVWAVSRQARLTLAGLLEARGYLTEKGAAELRERAARSGIPLARLAVDSGLVDGAEVESLQKILCSEIVFESLRWREGKFAFLKDRKPPEDVPSLRIGVHNLILEGARRQDEVHRLEEEAHVDLAQVVSLTVASDRLEGQVVLSPDEWGVVALLNGKRTLEEIFSLSPAGSEGETWKVLSRLQAARMIRIHPADVPLPDEEEPQAPLPTAEYPAVGSATLPERAPAPPEPRSVVSSSGSDVKLVVADDVTTKVGMFGRRVPARLVGAAAPGEPAPAFELGRPVLTIGRAPSNDIVLPDASVSKHHAQIFQTGDGWSLTDLSSTNGSWINGVRVVDQHLMPGDRIRIGTFELTFEVFADAGGA